MNNQYINTFNGSQCKRKNRFTFFIFVGAVLVILLICMLSSCGGRESHSKTHDDKVTGFERKSDILSQTNDKTAVVKEYPVSPASYTDNTADFSEDFSFTSAILIDINDNVVLAADNAEERIYPASLTKIMTLIVAVENSPSLDAEFTMTADILDPLSVENASVAGFSAGESVTVRDMLYGLMLPSGADGAVGLAGLVAGGEKEFVRMMNNKADELGLKNTHFENCTGLHHPNHYSTCHEIAKILEYAIKDEAILLTSTLFSRMYGNEPDSAFVVGGKTGFTLEAHHCLATFAVSCDEDECEESIYAKAPEYILVTIGSTDKWGPIFNAIDIYSAVSNDKDYGTVIEPAQK